MAKADIYQQVTDQIIASLESGALPWVKSWADNAAPVSLGVPHNRVSKKAYSGVNTLLLWSAKTENAFTGDCWLTYKQAQDLGGNVRKGEKGTRIVFFKPLTKDIENPTTGETETKGFAMARGYTVFNIDQCDNVDPLAVPETTPSASGSFMQDVARTIGADLRIMGNTACFIPSRDQVHMPAPEAFTSLDHFDATLAHELAHWTGHRSRLDRNLSGRFGSESYAAEELIAEIAAAYMSAEQGFSIEAMRHPGYIESWLKVLKNDKRAIFTAASQAQKATNYIKELALQSNEVAA